MSTNIEDLPVPSSNNVQIEINDKPVQNVVQQGGTHPQSQGQPAQQQQLSQEDLNKIITGIQQASNNNMTSLPSRDIPQDQQAHTQDQQVQPNYVPKREEKYIENDENIEDLINRNRLSEMKKDKQNQLMDEYQTPILIILLFFLFQLPVVNKSLYKYVPALFQKDGNMTLVGFTIKALVFGGLYYGLSKMMNYIES